jgi:hypothetical protein
MKTCTRCTQAKSISSFAPRQNATGIGLSPWCRKCKRDYDREKKALRDMEHKHRLHEEAVLREAASILARRAAAHVD